MLGQPAQRQLEHRPRGAHARMPITQHAHLGARLGAAQRGQARQRQGVDARQRLAALPGQRRAMRGGDAPAQGLAGQALHDEALAQAIGHLQHPQHLGHRHAVLAGQGDQRRLGGQAGAAG